MLTDLRGRNSESQTQSKGDGAAFSCGDLFHHRCMRWRRKDTRDRQTDCLRALDQPCSCVQGVRSASATALACTRASKARRVESGLWQPALSPGFEVEKGMAYRVEGPGAVGEARSTAKSGGFGGRGVQSSPRMDGEAKVARKMRVCEPAPCTPTQSTSLAPKLQVPNIICMARIAASPG